MIFIKNFFKNTYDKILGDVSCKFSVTTIIYLITILVCLYLSLSFDIDAVALIITAIVYTSINMVIRSASFKANEEKRMNDMTDNFVITFITTCLINDKFLNLPYQSFSDSILSFFILFVIALIIFGIIMLILYLIAKGLKRQEIKNHWNTD